VYNHIYRNRKIANYRYQGDRKNLSLNAAIKEDLLNSREQMQAAGRAKSQSMKNYNQQTKNCNQQMRN
jgi:protein required for attachment to host cells